MKWIITTLTSIIINSKIILTIGLMYCVIYYFICKYSPNVSYYFMLSVFDFLRYNYYWNGKNNMIKYSFIISNCANEKYISMHNRWLGPFVMVRVIWFKKYNLTISGNLLWMTFELMQLGKVQNFIDIEWLSK